MASNVDIANLALSHLGDDATIASLDPPEGSVQAEHCARFFPIARDALLNMHAWSFATRRVQPALLTATSDAWPYQYRLPSDCVRVLGMLPAGYTNDNQLCEEFGVESDDQGGVLLSTTENATLRYVSRVTDPTRYPPLFTEALAWLLASHVAGPLIKGDSGTKAATAAWQVFLTWFARATGIDANQAKLRLQHYAPWVRDRGWVECVEKRGGLYYSGQFYPPNGAVVL